MIPFTVEVYRIYFLNHHDYQYSMKLRKLILSGTINVHKFKDYSIVQQCLDEVYYALVFGEFFPQTDQRLTLRWDEEIMTGYTMWQKVSRGYIDLALLIHYQNFTIKWFVALVLANIAYILKNDICQLTAGHPRGWIGTYVAQFLSIVHETALEPFVSRTVNSVKNLLNCESGEPCNIEISRKIVNENLESLGVIDNNVSYDTIEIARDTLGIDLHKLEILFRLIKTEQKSLLINLNMVSNLVDYSVKHT